MEDTTFEDADSFSYGSNKDKLTFKQIVLEHLRKIGQYSSVEFRGGYWQVIPNQNPHSNVDREVYIPDSREVYSNAIECLADMLYPYFDKQMKEAEQKAREDLKKLYNDYTIVREEQREDENAEEGKKYRMFGKDLNRVTYRGLRVNVCRNLFRDLCSFLYRKRYLELGTLED